MRILLRIIAVGVGLVVVLTTLLIVQLGMSGRLMALVRSGALGLATAVGWLMTLSVGPSPRFNSGGCSESGCSRAQ